MGRRKVPARRTSDTNDAADTDAVSTVSTQLQAILEKMDNMSQRISNLELHEDNNRPSASINGDINIDNMDNDALRKSVERRLNSLRVINANDMDSDSETEVTFNAHNLPFRNKKANKACTSGKLRTLQHRVSESIEWPHFYIYRRDSKPVTCDSLSMSEFVHGYLVIMETQSEQVRTSMNTHLKELMADASTYVWATVRHYHSVILCMMETGRLEWSQRAEIQDLRRQHVWVTPIHSMYTSPSQGYTKPCRDYQVGKCAHSSNHDGYAHACSYCLTKTGRQYGHAEHECRRKSYGVTPPTSDSDPYPDSSTQAVPPKQPDKDSLIGGK